MKVKFESKLSNRFINAVSQALLAICRGVKFESKLSNHFINAVSQALLAICRGVSYGRSGNHQNYAKQS